MVTEIKSPPATESEVKPTLKRKRRAAHYVSRHFTPQPEISTKNEQSRRRKKKKKVEKEEEGSQHENAVIDLETVTDVSTRKRRSFITGKQNGPGTSGFRPKKKSRDTKPSSRQDVNTQKSNAADSSNSKAQRQPENQAKISNKPIEDAQADHSSNDANHLVPWQQVLAAPVEDQQRTFQRIFFGLNVDALSSDSDLTDVPKDIGPDPFESQSTRSKKRKSSRKTVSKDKESELVAVKEKKAIPTSKPKSKTGLTKSPYFPHAHKPRPTFLSTLPFPPLHLERFGLMQERLCHDPFRLLLATIFLNKTPGQRAMPIFFKLMEKYPTPERLARAVQADVTEIIHELGFQNQRARKCIAMAQRWVEDPPVKGRRWRKVDYPRKRDGKDIKIDEVISDEDERVAWEISHLPGLGPYSHDSWRMFCRDELRGLTNGYNGEGVQQQDGKEPFEPEWKRVLPTDKELRAWMTWMWMKEGWVWNKETGERTKASEELMELARGKGNIVLESEANTLTVKSLDETQPTPLKLASQVKKNVKVDVPAGDFMPDRPSNTITEAGIE